MYIVIVYIWCLSIFIYRIHICHCRLSSRVCIASTAVHPDGSVPQGPQTSICTWSQWQLHQSLAGEPKPIYIGNEIIFKFKSSDNICVLRKSQDLIDIALKSCNSFGHSLEHCCNESLTICGGAAYVKRQSVAAARCNHSLSAAI